MSKVARLVKRIVHRREVPRRFYPKRPHDPAMGLPFCYMRGIPIFADDPSAPRMYVIQMAQFDAPCTGEPA